MRLSKYNLGFIALLLAAGVPCEAAKRTPAPSNLPSYDQQLPVIFVNETGGKIRAEMTCAPASNFAKRPRLAETHWIRALGQAKFVTGMTNEVLQFAVFNNGKKSQQQRFGPFQEKTAQTIKWDGRSIVREAK